MKMRLFVGIVLVLGFIGIALPVAGQSRADLEKSPSPSVSSVVDKAKTSAALPLPTTPQGSGNLSNSLSNSPETALLGDLIAYYPFDDGTATDATGNGYNGTIQGTPTIVPGAIGNALHFTGCGFSSTCGDHVLIPSLDFANMGDFSISLWVNEEGFSHCHGESYISFGDHLAGSIHFGNYAIDAVCSYMVYGFSVNVTPFLYRNDLSHRNQWTLYTLVYEKGIVKFYINDSYLGGGAQTVLLGSNNAAIARHWWGGATSTRFTGSIDDVRIYNRALSATEITELYARINYAISGRVVDGSGNGIAGVSISGGVGYSTSTDSSGNYTLSGFVPGVYAITPSKTGYTFNPISRAINIVSGNMTGVDFTGTQAIYSISGRVANASSNGIAGVSVSDGAGHTASTDSSGNYTLSGFVPGVYAITPSKTGYTFNPISRAINIVNGNMAGVDFTGAQTTYSISGRVVDGSNPISGVIVATRSSNSATTNTSGVYAITDLITGTYTITPTKNGYTFSPASRMIDVPPDAAGQDFIGSKTCQSMADTDGDGLLDGWELCGYNGVDLPAMGANPLKKDIFVEIDYMVDQGICLFGHCAFGYTHKPKPEAIEKVVQAFANAPVSNPDLSTGIVLHVQVSNEIPHQDTLQPIGQTWDWSGFNKIKNYPGNFDSNRAKIFHYAIFAHDLGGNLRGNNIPPGTSGLANTPGSDLIVSLGTGWSDGGSVNEQAGTFMHELGHNLGLRHGGDDDQNFEPNYLSVMNYSFQTNGLIFKADDGLLDYSRFGNIPPLNEEHLNETVGLNGGSAITDYGTRYYCHPLGIPWERRITKANDPIDWDCFLGSGGTDVQANINNGDGSTLTGFDDWPALVFDGGDIGPDAGMATHALSAASSIQTEELTFETDSQFYKPYKIAFSGGGDVVASLNVTTTTFITLTNLGALTATVPISYIPGIGWFDLSAVPLSVTLTSSASLSIPITLTVPVSRTGAISDSVIISAVVQESPLMGDSTALSARIGPLARYVAEPVRGTEPLTVTFGNASIGNITAWLWNLGDGVTSTLPSPTHTYATSGAYTVTLTISGPDGSDEEIKAALIQAYEPVQAAFVANPTSGVVPLVVTFTNTSTGDYATSWWNFGDGVTSTLDSPTHTYTTGKAYTVTLTVSGLGGTDTSTRTNYISVTWPLANIIVTPTPITMTVSATQTFSASGIDAGGSPMAISPTWNTDAGTMTGNVLTARTTPASGLHITATIGSISGTAIVDIIAGSLNRLTITPTVVTLTTHTTQQFTAVGFDVYNNVITHPSIVWQVTPIHVGVIDATGWFTAGNKAGVYPNAIIAASGSISVTAKVIVQPHQVYLPAVLR
jgi:PKD repeat protein